ncbi:MAG: DUF4886 domain-containing protein [Candidatus Goldiibacteriota bacterium]|jgi:hypothetical protein
MFKRIIFFVLPAIIVFFTSCGDGNPALSGPEISILFIGNSFTSVNDLPGLFTKLAASGGHPVRSDMYAPGGYRLIQHMADQNVTRKLLDKKWDYIVLQEQSQVPAIENEKNNNMYPAVRGFFDRIKAAGAVPILYMTWGRKNGCPEIGYSDYTSMQERLIDGYMGIANELSMEVSPVGVAWKTAHELRPELELWGTDGIHPDVAGSYLAACVFYTVIYGKTPEGLNFTAGLPRDTAGFLQKTGGETVLSDPKKWFIPGGQQPR